MWKNTAELQYMKKFPEYLDYRGNITLLNKRKISMVGSRKPNQYAQEITSILAQRFTKAGLCVVSGGAIGIDAIAHRSAKSDQTICVLPCGINQRYPAIHRHMLDEISVKGLLLSQFEPDFKATRWSFVARNELVVALGEILIVTYADLNSGSMSSAEIALNMGKKIYVIPHRLGESEGTNQLLKTGKAEAIWDIDAFMKQFDDASQVPMTEDPFLTYCAQRPTFEEVVTLFGQRAYEAELEGEIIIANGRVMPA